MPYPLKDTQILVLDCQTTGGNASKHHLIEIGWMPVRARDAFAGKTAKPVTHIIETPRGVDLPRHVRRLTGLEENHFKDAIAPQKAWRKLKAHAVRMAAANPTPYCPVVIHYARFETAFLRRLHAEAPRPDQFPLEVLCSHQMAARVWPQLPRKGLRAVAGYLGHSVPPLKRCDSHLLATAAIWSHVVDRLDRRFGVRTLEDLRAWLQQPVRSAPVPRSFPMSRQKRLSVPAQPGIYYFRRSNDDLLYIGKAASLKNRINSYFQSSRHHSESTLEMLTQAVKLDITQTPTALEAALLESDEIKRRQPPYNRALRTDHRKLDFISRDFRQSTPKAAPCCPLGPVPTPEFFFALHAMGQALQTDRTVGQPVDNGQVLCLSGRDAPDRECFRQGMDLFRSQNSALLEYRDPLSGLLRIGHISWREKIARQAQSADEPDPVEAKAPGPAEAEPFEWTPKAVAKTMTSIARRCGFLLRRSRWMILLSESTIAWQAPDASSGHRNLLILQGGSISRREQTTDSTPLPPPPGIRLPLPERKANLDLTTYDRLRVLTTELRRLVTEDRLVTVRLNPRTSLHQTQLRQLFRWI